jgi:hemoglobin
VALPLGRDNPPYAHLGRDGAFALAARFYDFMEANEPPLVAVHKNDGRGRVIPEVRETFGAFLVQWMGGPTLYSDVHGPLRLNKRHAHIPIGTDLRDAWMRCMTAALDHPDVSADVREHLRAQFAEVTDFLRNQPDH